MVTGRVTLSLPLNAVPEFASGARVAPDVENAPHSPASEPIAFALAGARQWSVSGGVVFNVRFIQPMLDESPATIFSVALPSCSTAGVTTTLSVADCTTVGAAVSSAVDQAIGAVSGCVISSE